MRLADLMQTRQQMQQMKAELVYQERLAELTLEKARILDETAIDAEYEIIKPAPLAITDKNT